MYELEQLNPSVSEATVYKHVQHLIEAGVVEEVPSPPMNADMAIRGNSTG
jgi:Fe2+ or Zn2+ uptake regulation protein